MNTLAFEKQVEDGWRRYAGPAASRHLSNEVDQAAVDAMEAAVVGAYPAISHRYYALKAKVMGKTVLDQWDRNAPLTDAVPRKYSWDEAKALVLESFQALAPQFADTARTFFARPWIDAAPHHCRDRLDLWRGAGVRTSARPGRSARPPRATRR